MKARSNVVLALVLVLLALGLLACKKEAPPEPAVPPAPLASGHETQDLPPGHPPIGETGEAGGRGPSELAWSVPAKWKEVPPASSMRWAQYAVPGAKGDGELVVFFFGPGQGGDAKANAERWAGQFEQPDGSSSIAKMKTTTVEVGSIRVLQVEVGGTYLEGMAMSPGAGEPKKDWALLGAIAETPAGNKWFFKLTGPAATLEAERAGFETLVQSLAPAGASV